MRLATLKDGTRDGKLILVSSDMTRAVAAGETARTLQGALDDWERVSPQLHALNDALNVGPVDGEFAFSAKDTAAPLPRAYQWCDGSAYLSHAELVRKARNAEMPQFLYSDPLMYQGASDTLCGALDPIEVATEDWGIDLEAEVGVIVDDVPMGVSVEAAAKHIRLIVLINDVSLRNLIPHELSKGFGFFHSKPATAFAAVAITPDELAPHWDGAKLNVKVRAQINGELLGEPHAGTDLNFDFPTLIAHAARSRHLAAGTIIGSGTVSNRDPAAGSACLQERRMLETIANGKPSTPFLKFGDLVEISALRPDGSDLFGPIRQTVVQYLPK